MRSVGTLALFTAVAAMLGVPAPGSAQEPGAAAIERQFLATTLHFLIRGIESEQMIVFSPPGNVSLNSLAILDREQVAAIAGHRVFTGELHPDSVESWTRQQVHFSRVVIRLLKEQLEKLEESEVITWQTPWPPAAGLATFRGGIRGSWEITCRRQTREFKNWGTWFLEFKDNGTVDGWFEDTTGAVRPVSNGTVQDNGLAQGQATTIVWSATFERDGNSLAITGGKGSLGYNTTVMSEPWLTCNPGSFQLN